MTEMVRLPEFGGDLADGVLVAVDKARGDIFAAGEPLFEVEIKKVVFEVNAGGDGTVLNVLVKEGAQVSAGQPVMQVDYREESL